ncbi:MAG: alpha/beta hydrolase [Verrucomicrobiota bacterium]
MKTPWHTQLTTHLEQARAWLTGPTYHDLTYHTVNGRPLSLDLYLPFFQQNCPLVIYLHGGGWSHGTYKEAGARWLVGHGFAVASVEYRFTSEATFPAQINDVKNATLWLKDNATTYHYNASKIGIFGVSSGGHLAMLAGSENHPEDPDCPLVHSVVNLFGASDLILRSQTQPTHTEPPHSVVHQLLGTSPTQNPQLARQASPAFQVHQHSAPLLVIHGQQDQQVKVDQAHRIVEAYQQANKEVQIDILPHSGHGGPEFFNKSRRHQIAHFLASHLKPQIT